MKTIEEFTEFGSGYKIAQRDLLIRGAGDILGPEQAGYIDQIGIELYMKLLDEAIKGNNFEIEDTIPIKMLSLDAYIPNKYAIDADKIEIYQQIEETKNQREVTDQIMLRSSGLTETYMMNDVTIIELFESSRKSGFFGLGYSRDSKNQSTLLNRLFTLANKKKVFYIDSDKNILSIGDYPQKFYELKSNGYKIKQCNLIFDYSPIQNDGYRCKVDSIYFKLNSSNKYFHYIINQEISFSPGANLIYVPIDIMDTLANDFLPKSIYEQCEYIQEQQRFVRCNTDFDPSQLKELKPISFVFNSFSISIPPSDLFDTIDGNKYFMFANNRLQQKYWKFGYPLLKHNLIAFDLEDNVISFIPKQ